MQNVLHARNVQLGVHMQTHHSNQTLQNLEKSTFIGCTVRNMQMQESYKSLPVTKSLGNDLMQCAYIIYPAAMMLPSKRQAHNVTIHMLAAKI